MRRILTIAAFVLLVGTAAAQRPFKITRIDLRTGDIIVAQTIWTSNTSTDLTAAGNWSNGTPDSTHTPAVFNGSGQASVDTNMAALAAEAFGVIVTPEYTGNIGGPNNYLQYDGAGHDNTFRGGGEVYLNNTENDSTGKFTVDSRNIENAFTSVGQTPRLYVKSGYVTILPTGQVTILGVSGSDSTVEIQDADSTEWSPLIVAQDGGVILSARSTDNANITANINIGGGLYRLTGELGSTTGAYTRFIMTGGRCEYAYDAVSDRLPIIAIYGNAVFDASAMSKAWTALSFTVGPNATYISDPGGSLSTLTTLTILSQPYP